MIWWVVVISLGLLHSDELAKLGSNLGPFRLEIGMRYPAINFSIYVLDFLALISNSLL